MTASTIDEVIQELAVIVDDSQRDQDSLGYFPALYQRVTEAVRDGIAAGRFEDGARMERFDVIFANRYLDAYAQRRAGSATTESWALAFDMAEDYWPTVLQHLMAGMNAHILLDLGVAAAQTAPGDELVSLEGDFARINEILFSLIDTVQDQLAEIWGPFGFLDRIAGRLDENFGEYSMERCRDAAWKVAEGAAHLQGDTLAAYIDERDRRVSKLGELIRRPGFVLNLKLKIVRPFEHGRVAERIDILSR